MTDHIDKVRERAQAEALVEVGFWPHDLEEGDGKAIFADGAAWLASRLTREKIAAVIRAATDDGANCSEDYADAVLDLIGGDDD